MTGTAWTLQLPAVRVDEFSNLMTELNEEHLDGPGARARVVAGYHQERIWLQPDRDGSAEFRSWDATTAVLDVKEELS